MAQAQERGSSDSAGPTVAPSPKSPPGAISDEARVEASNHFRRGVELYQESAYRAALVEFERAHDIAPDYRLLYNIGQTRLQIQDYLGATQAYEEYLTQGGADVPPARRADVESALAALRERVGRISISANLDGAEVFVDDVKAGVTPLPSTVGVNVGRHRIYAQKDGAIATAVVDVAGGDLAEVALKLKAPAIVVAPTTPAGAADEKLSTMRRAAIAAWIVGGLAGGAAIATGIVAKGKTDDLNSALDTVNANSAKKVADYRSSADALAITTDVLAGLAVAGIATGVVLWVVDRGSDGDDQKDDDGAKAQLDWRVGPASLSVQGRF